MRFGLRINPLSPLLKGNLRRLNYLLLCGFRCVRGCIGLLVGRFIGGNVLLLVFWCILQGRIGCFPQSNVFILVLWCILEGRTGCFLQVIVLMLVVWSILEGRTGFFSRRNVLILFDCCIWKGRIGYLARSMGLDYRFSLIHLSIGCSGVECDRRLVGGGGLCIVFQGEVREYSSFIFYDLLAIERRL